MSRSLAKLQSWMLWVAGVLAVLGSIGLASLPLQVLFLQANILMPIVGLLCFGSAFIVSERATLDERDPSLSRRIRIWALLVLGILSVATMLPIVSLPLQMPFARMDMLMLLIGFGCLFFAYVGTKT